MEMSGDKLVAAPPAAVWAALIDPEFLKALIPGCESMTGDPASGYDITVRRAVGGMSARMTGRFDLTDLRPAEGCLLTGHGRAGGAGEASGSCRIRLAPEGAGTRLSWQIAAETGGRLASIPDFIVTMAARKVADGFVERFAAALEGRDPAARKGWLGRITGRG